MPDETATATAPNTASPANGLAPVAPPAHQPPAQPSEIFQRPPVGAPGGPPPQQTVTVPLDVWQEAHAYKQRLSEFEAQRNAAVEAEAQKAIRAMAEKGQIEQAFEEHRKLYATKEQEAQQRYAALAESYNGEKINAELATATSGVRFASDEAARVFRASVRDLLTVVENPDGSKVVVDRVGRRPAADVIRERLSDPSLAFYLAPSTTRGGAGTDGTRPPANTQIQPGSLDAIAAEFQARQGQYPAFGLAPKPN